MQCLEVAFARFAEANRAAKNATQSKNANRALQFLDIAFARFVQDLWNQIVRLQDLRNQILRCKICAVESCAVDVCIVWSNRELWGQISLRAMGGSVVVFGDRDEAWDT